MRAGPDARRYLGATLPECCVVFPFLLYEPATVMFAALGNGVFFLLTFMTLLWPPQELLGAP
jgi:hypothetical protein